MGAFGIVAVKLLGDALTAQRQPLLSSVPVGFGLVFTVALDTILIPRHGGMGAAIASAIAYTVAGIAACATFAIALGARKRDLAPQRGDLAQVRLALRRRREAEGYAAATSSGSAGA